MQKVLPHILILTVVLAVSAFAISTNQVSLFDSYSEQLENRTAIIESSQQSIKLDFDLKDLESNVISDGVLSSEKLSLPGEGFTLEKNKYQQ